MPLLRMAMISPAILRPGRVIHIGRTNSVNRSGAHLREAAQPAPRADRRNWRQTLADAYPLGGMALLLGYLIRTLASHLYLAD
ncbi:MAG TPA: hypothetical protein VHC19_13395 [Pirellulales bacterium]|nr:hypothetical protein [Pirellulales bacterium]